MAQTEERKRLLKDGKIVGELRIFYADWKGECVQQFFDANKPHDSSAHKLVPYDSFELGIKGGDEFWFEGDIIEYQIFPDSDLNRGELTCSCYQWYIITINKHGVKIAIPFHDTEEMQLRKRIGNIHEESEADVT